MSWDEVFLLENEFVLLFHFKFWLRRLGRLRRSFGSRLLFRFASCGDFFHRNRRRRSLARCIQGGRGDLGRRNCRFLVDLEFFDVRWCRRPRRSSRRLGWRRGWCFHLWRGLMRFFQKRSPLVGQVDFLNLGFCRRSRRLDRLRLRSCNWRLGWTRGRSRLFLRGYGGNFRYTHLLRRLRRSLLRRERGASQFFVRDSGGALEAATQFGKALGAALVARFGVNL